MFGGDEKIRAFPFRPAAEVNSLTEYVEISGCNRLLVEAVKKLYEVPNKPENPIEWLRLYFKYLAEDASAALISSTIGLGSDINGSLTSSTGDFFCDPDDIEMQLKDELASIEADIINCFEQEAQGTAIIERLDNELKRVTLGSAQNQWHDDFRLYLEHGENYHYRIRPDPMYQASNTDLLLDDEHVNDSSKKPHGEFGRVNTGKRDDSIVELVPFNSKFWIGEHSHLHSKHSNLSRNEELKMYEDYPQLYFPERQRMPPAAQEEELVENEKNEDEDELGNEEEEGEEVISGPDVDKSTAATTPRHEKGKKRGSTTKGDASSEYDGGSEGGESDQSRVRSKVQSAYTPRSAHDKKHHRDKHSQKSQHKAAPTSDKNM